MVVVATEEETLAEEMVEEMEQAEEAMGLVMLLTEEEMAEEMLEEEVVVVEMILEKEETAAEAAEKEVKEGNMEITAICLVFITSNIGRLLLLNLNVKSALPEPQPLLQLPILLVKMLVGNALALNLESLLPQDFAAESPPD